MKPINVLSLFDGISCGQVALERIGIPVKNYYASEINKYAIKITQKNYPQTIQIGDVSKIKYKNKVLYNSENGKYWEIDNRIDLILTGSPCQGFSFAGKQLNFEDPRSKLFFEFIRLLKEVKPKYFLLENVRMKKEYQDVISEKVGVEPIKINSALVSAQNRVRLYWTNIKYIRQPRDKGLLLKDIIETGLVDKNKSYAIDANYFKGGNLEQYFIKKRRRLIFKNPVLWQLAHGANKGGFKAINGKTPTITTSQWQYNNLLCTFKEGNFKKFLQEKNIKFLFNNQYIIDVDEQICSTRANKYRMSHIRGINEKSRCLTAHCSNIQNAGGCGLFIEGSYRKLTPIECERLQTLPDNYTEGISNTQRYKCLGNGWTVDVIKYILSYAKFGE
ncbi:MAG: DNA (cytosine-5-)-methyltransferase [Candidatus Helarchaeota archaeon]